MSEELRDQVFRLVAAIYYRISNEDTADDEVWELGDLAGVTDPEDALTAEQMRAWLAANL